MTKDLSMAVTAALSGEWDKASHRAGHLEPRRRLDTRGAAQD